MRLALGMWNYFHNFFVLTACQFVVAQRARVFFGHFGRKQVCRRLTPRFGLIIELIIGNDIKCMEPILSRYQRTKLRVREKRSQWRDYFYRARHLTAFMMRFFRDAVKPPYEGREILYQCYLVGYKSTFLIGLTGFIMGVVLTIQSRPSMAQFGAIS